MWIRWIKRSAILGLGVCFCLAAAPIGCGGQPSDSSTAVLVPEPNSLTTKASPAGSAAPATSAPAAATPDSTASTRRSRPRVGEHSRVRLFSVAILRLPKFSSSKGRRRRIPKSAPKIVRLRQSAWSSTRQVRE